ncbi:hypothetical protein [Gordonia sp. 852002-10350_SCH5691597]|uniref:hypothetical protein n=1 Tax=Gordonia sp. 852002-10350_SCH5691597 TaxID=1834085 RepID=UPI0007EAA947|nr:hypothetical protein [Gordonia sp. 852002-10350_SCH5691597]OBA57707.1 hypothetical protein A5777_06710 [Gordonia sp. 852002-10350_SCH5691597]
MTDFFTMPGGVVNLQSEDGIANLGGTERSSMAYVQPPSNTKDDGGTVRFNTIDWERRAKVAADARTQIDIALESLKEVASTNHFGDLVEGIEVHARLRALIATWQGSLRQQGIQLLALETQCRSASDRLTEGDSSSAKGFST